jgi:hypothetical protein
MAENKLADLSMDFAVEILKVCDRIKGRKNELNNEILISNANYRKYLKAKIVLN